MENYFTIVQCQYIAEMNELLLTGLSVDGDSQGVERLYGALSAHMWPGMILKSGDRISQPSLPQKEGFSSLNSFLFLGASCMLFLFIYCKC